MILSQGITINTEQIIYICTLVAAVWAVYKIYKEINKPNDNVRTMVKNHDEKLKKEDNRLKEQEETNRMILQCMLDLINHEITGNGIDKLKERRDSLQEFLINK